MRVLLLLSMMVLTTSCGHCSREMAGIKGYYRICVDGVSYLQFTSGSTVEYNIDGNIKLCE